MKIIEKKPEDLIPYEFNNKIHDEVQINRIANSIREFGFLQPVVIDKNNIIIVGHGRVEGAKKLGLTKVPCIMADELTDEQIKKYRILDNKLNESEYDLANLKLELESLENLNIGELDLGKRELFPEMQTEEFDLLNQIGNDTFSDFIANESDIFSITFNFPKEEQAEVEQYIKDNGKEVVVAFILDKIKEEGAE